MDENKITTVEKVKDPRRVEQGKKLAAISREAKERKARERATEAVKTETTMDVLPYLVIVSIVVICGGYYYYNNIKKEEPPREEPIKKPTPKLDQLLVIIKERCLLVKMT